jgi:hypothetical protein
LLIVRSVSHPFSFNTNPHVLLNDLASAVVIVIFSSARIRFSIVLDNLKSSTTFANAFNDAIIGFTHFAKMEDDVGTATHTMFVRCMAIIYWSSQNITDLLIPVLLKSGETLQESVMTGLLIQVKRRAKPRDPFYGTRLTRRPSDSSLPLQTVRQIRVHMSHWSPNCECSSRSDVVTETKVRDRLTGLVLDSLTLETPRKPTVFKAPTIFAMPSKLHIPVQPYQIGHPRDVHPRYSIYAYGCSDTVYSVISHSDRPVYTFLREIVIFLKSIFGRRPIR